MPGECQQNVLPSRLMGLTIGMNCVPFTCSKKAGKELSSPAKRSKGAAGKAQVQEHQPVTSGAPESQEAAGGVTAIIA